MWTFESSSGSKTYETLKWNDGSTSCDCMGWCRRVAADGSRTCKHTRSVEAGRGSHDSIFNAPVGAGKKSKLDATVGPIAVDIKTTKPAKPVLKQSTFARKFS